MRRLLLLIIVALIGFYIAWPAYSGWQIKSALANGDADALAGKVSFDRVRDSLKPAAEKRVAEELAKVAKSLRRAGISRFPGHQIDGANGDRAGAENPGDTG